MPVTQSEMRKVSFRLYRRTGDIPKHLAKWSPLPIDKNGSIKRRTRWFDCSRCVRPTHLTKIRQLTNDWQLFTFLRVTRSSIPSCPWIRLLVFCLGFSYDWAFQLVTWGMGINSVTMAAYASYLEFSYSPPGQFLHEDSLSTNASIYCLVVPNFVLSGGRTGKNP